MRHFRHMVIDFLFRSFLAICFCSFISLCADLHVVSTYRWNAFKYLLDENPSLRSEEKSIYAFLSVREGGMNVNVNGNVMNAFCLQAMTYAKVV